MDIRRRVCMKRFNPYLTANGGYLSSPVADTRPTRSCDLSCKWVTLKGRRKGQSMCDRDKDFLLEWFEEHGRFHIALQECAHKYPRCSMYEAKECV